MRVVCLLLGAAAALAQHNPVLPGDHPDPSVIRVGKQYWATATTSGYAPIFPLLVSEDLKNWRTTGAVFSQRPDWADTNFWAPEIAEDSGRYFIYYTAKKRAGPLCVAVASADEPGGPYTDHGPLVCQEIGSIDAFPVTDDEGQRWLIWKEDGNSKRQPTPLWAQRLTADGLKLTGEKVELFRNDAPWEGHVVEGPFVLKRRGWWYMFYSGAGCCGLKCNYALGVARAKKLLGPWEKYEGNPILRASDSWICPGHGSIVEDPDGRMWLLYHAYHSKDFISVGRQGLLDEVTWNEDGWPAINGPGEAVESRLRTFVDEFDEPLSAEWSWPVAQRTRARTVDGMLEIEGDSVLTRIPTTAAYTAETAVELGTLTAGASAGIAAFAGRANVVALTAKSDGSLSLWRREKGVDRELAQLQIDAKTLHLRLRVEGGRLVSFGFSADGNEWTDAGEAVDADVAGRMALIVTGENEPRARFAYFRVGP